MPHAGVLTFIQKNDNNGDSAPDFFPNLKGGSSSKFPNKLVMPAGVDASGGASITLRDKVFKKGDIKFGNKKGWRATGYNHPHTKVMDVFSDSNFNNANPLYCWASGCANTFSSSCSNSDCGSAKALMAYGPYSKGSTVTVYGASHSSHPPRTPCTPRTPFVHRLSPPAIQPFTMLGPPPSPPISPVPYPHS